MLIKRRVLDGIAAGELDLAFRKWDRARVRAGTRLRTAVGLVEVVNIAEIDTEPSNSISEMEARRAGFSSTLELARETNSRDGTLYRIELRHAGEDPRIALRKRSRFRRGEAEALEEKLRKMDSSSRNGPWTRQTLRLIQERPAVRAPELAASVGRETKPFKADVRKLKEQGLTESLKVGYRVSPRGLAFLEYLGQGSAGASKPTKQNGSARIIHSTRAKATRKK